MQESRFKVGSSLRATVAREIARNAPRRRLLKQCVDTMASMSELVVIKEKHDISTKSTERQRKAAFLEAFEVANQKLFR